MSSTTALTFTPQTNLGTVTSWLPVPSAYNSGTCTPLYSKEASLLWMDFAQINNNTNCDPIGVSYDFESEGADGTITKTSIGPLSCLSQYATMRTSVSGGPAGSVVSVTCCPSGYTPNTVPPGGECTSTLSSGANIYFVDSTFPAPPTFMMSSVTAPTQVNANAAFGINRVDPISSSLATPTPPFSSNSTTPAGKNSSPLSKIGLIGLIIGVSIGIVIIGFVGWLILRYRIARAQKARDLIKAQTLDRSWETLPGWDEKGGMGVKVDTVFELSANEPLAHEMFTSEALHELGPVVRITGGVP